MGREITVTLLTDDTYSLIVCTGCHESYQVAHAAEKCPGCQRPVGVVRKVYCAHFRHNNERGCGNPCCWKHPNRRTIGG